MQMWVRQLLKHPGKKTWIIILQIYIIIIVVVFCFIFILGHCTNLQFDGHAMQKVLFKN